MKQKFKHNINAIVLVFSFLILGILGIYKTVLAADCSDIVNGPCTEQAYLNDCSPAYEQISTSVFGQPGYCSYSKFRVHTYNVIMSGGVETSRNEVLPPGACVTDPGSVDCHTYPNYTLQGCNVDADCATSDACNVGTCSGLYTYNYVCNHDFYGNPITCYNAVKTCKVTNIASCQVPVGPYCGNSVCDGGETSGTCPGDCPPPSSCPFGTEPSVSIDNTAYEFRGGQGEVIVTSYRVGSNAYAQGASETFTCPASSSCNGSPNSPQAFGNPADPVDIYNYSVRTTTLGSQVIRQTAQAGSNDPFGRCPSANFVGSANIFVYRGDPYNVTVSSSTLCGVNQVSWSKYNIDDLFNVYRSSGGGPTTLIASNVPTNSYTDASAVVGTKYRYYVQIANRNTPTEPVGNFVSAAENFAPTNGVAPVFCPSVNLTASPTSVSSGGSSTLTWTVANVTSCSTVGANAMPSGNWSSGSSGSASTGALVSSKSYQISCTGNGATVLSPIAAVTVGTPPAVLSFSPSSFSFNTTPGGTPAGQTLNISNTAAAGASNLTWSVSVSTSSGGAWLTASRASCCTSTGGTETPGGSASPPITVTASAASLAAGTYNGTITLTSNDPTKLTNTIPVTLTVGNNPAILSFSPSSFIFSATAGTSAAGQTLNISNIAAVGSSNLTWSVSVTTGSSWLTATRGGGQPQNGTEVPGGSASPPITVTASAASLAAGTYNGVITLTSNDPTKLTQNLAVTFNVSAAGNPYAACNGAGTIKRDYWTGISGNLVTDLTGLGTYPNSPTGTASDSSFEAPSNWADSYGQRVYGTVVAPATGSYTFYIASDDSSELWLGTTSSSASKVKIAYLNGWAAARNWSANSTQQSAPINLVQGQTYYIEAIHKEGAGGDNLAVGWIIPSSATIDVIPGACLNPPPVGAPSVTLTVDNSSVSSGGQTTLRWTIANASSCVNAAGHDPIPAANWNTGTSGNVSTGALTTNHSYQLSCTGNGTTLSSVVTVTVPVTPDSGGICNSGPSCSPTPPGGGSTPACSKVRLFWVDNSNNETGFKIYKDSVFVATAPASSPASATGGMLSYDYSPGDSSLHAYSVAATTGSADSAQITITSPGGFAATPCSPNLTGSDKDITSVNSVAVAYKDGLGNTIVPSICDSQTQPLPSTLNLKKDDVLSFKINICNNNGTATTTGISIVDRMVNLVSPTGGFNVKYNGGSVFVRAADCLALGSIPSNQYSVCGSVPTQTITINLGSTQIAPGVIGNITFDAKLAVPGGFNGQSARFQNSFTISSNAPSAIGNTPLLPFYSGNGSSSIIEIP